jgi:hypothetical protein
MLLPSPQDLEKLYDDNRANLKNRKQIAISKAVDYTLLEAVQQIKDRDSTYMTITNFKYENIEVSDYHIAKELKSLGYYISDDDDDESEFESNYYLHFKKP